MKKPRLHLSYFFLIFFLAAIASPMVQAGEANRQAKKKIRLNITKLYKELAPRYKDWYDLVDYIISELEERIFFQLENDKERDAFIKLFWKMRDPTPETEDNEFKLEHLKRFNYANRRFKYGTSRKGWQTEMGMIHIILGRPQSIDRYEDERMIEPLQIWSYYGVRRPGLPNAFNIVFWQHASIGEFKLYNPQADGPYALLKKNSDNINLDPFDYEKLYQVIAEYSQIVAMASLSLIPNEPAFNYTPSLQSSILLKNVEQLPTKKINTRYASDFLAYKGIVTVDYSSTFMECFREVHVARNPETGLNLIHFSILPKTLSVSNLLDQGKFVFSFKVTVNLKKGKQKVFSYTKNFPFKASSEEEIRRRFAQGVIISDSFPAPAGTYKLEVLIQNPVKSEFSFFDKSVTIPAETNKIPNLLGPILTYEIKRNPSLTFAPYKFREYEVTLNPRKDYGKKDTLYVFLGVEQAGDSQKELKVMLEVEDIFEREKYHKSYQFAVAAGKKYTYLTQQLEQLPPGNYTLAAKVMSASGSLLAVKDFRFQVSLLNNIPRPTVAKKITSFQNRFLQYHVLGLQYQRLNQLEKAEKYMKQALSLKPDHPRLIKDYCGLLLNKRDFAQIIQIIERLKGQEKGLFDYYTIRGKVLYFQGKFAEAIEVLLKANTIYDSDIGVLNFLGYAYLKTNNKAEAEKAFTASLRINEKQSNIKKVLGQISAGK